MEYNAAQDASDKTAAATGVLTDPCGCSQCTGRGVREGAERSSSREIMGTLGEICALTNPYPNQHIFFDAVPI